MSHGRWLTVYFTLYDIYLATRPNLAAEFGTPSTVEGVNEPGVDGGPWISGEGKILYFDSDRAGSFDLYRTEPLPSGSFAAPTSIAELNTEHTERFLVPSDDELTIFFGSARPGGSGGVDIWVATRASTRDPFSLPERVDELASSDSDRPGGCRRTAVGCTCSVTGPMVPRSTKISGSRSANVAVAAGTQA